MNETPQGLLSVPKLAVSDVRKPKYMVISAPGSVQLRSIGGYSNGKPPRRDETPIRAWSKKSRNNFLFQLSTLDYSVLPEKGLPAMVTLTYPGDWLTVVPSRRAFNQHWSKFLKRWERAWGEPLKCIWKVEFQRRGAPHIHFFTHVPTSKSESRRRAFDGLEFADWLSTTWADVVAHPDPVERERHRLAGTAVDSRAGFAATSRKKVASYFLKHSDPAGRSKEGQHQPPQAWRDAGSVGRFWGYIGIPPRLTVVEVSEGEFVRARRIVRKVHKSKTGARGRALLCRSAAIHGGFVLSSDGERLGRSLLEACSD